MEARLRKLLALAEWVQTHHVAIRTALADQQALARALGAVPLDAPAVVVDGETLDPLPDDERAAWESKATACAVALDALDNLNA